MRREHDDTPEALAPGTAGVAMSDTLPDSDRAARVVAFWRDAGPSRWFAKNEAFDRDFRERFLDAHLAAARRELDGWCDNAEACLALLILTDQFPRNAFRGTAHMFATDALARHFARIALHAGHMRQVAPALRPFFCLPFEHSEDLADQDLSVELFATLDAASLSWAEKHRDIIRRFGRFPHRNALLLRTPTPEELAFLDAGGFAG